MKKENRGRYLIKNTAIFTLGNLGMKFVSFFIVPLYTYILSTSEYGTIDLVTTIGMVIAPIIMLNINEGVMRFSLDKHADYNKIMSIGLCIFGFAILVGLSIIPLSFLIETIEEYGKYIYLYLVSYAGNLLFMGYLRGKEKLLQFSLGNISNAFLIAILNIVFLVVFKWGISGYFYAFTIANFITCIYAFFAGDVISVIKKFKIDYKLFVKMTKYSLVLIPNSFMWWIINSSDRIMITGLIGSAANGIYAVAYKIPSLLSTFVTIFNQAWSYSAIKENESSDREEYSNKIYNGLVMVTIMLGVFMLIIIKPFLKIYVAPSYYDAWRYTPFLIIGFVYLSLGTFLGTYYTVYKDSKGFLLSATCGALVNVILNFVFIPIAGINGAAFATCTSYLAIFIYRIFDTRKYIKINVWNRNHLVAYLLLFISGITIFLKGIMGYVFLIFEFLCVVILFRNTWMSMITSILSKYIKRM